MSVARGWAPRGGLKAPAAPWLAHHEGVALLLVAGAVVLLVRLSMCLSEAARAVEQPVVTTDRAVDFTATQAKFIADFWTQVVEALLLRPLFAAVGFWTSALWTHALQPMWYVATFWGQVAWWLLGGLVAALVGLADALLLGVAATSSGIWGLALTLLWGVGGVLAHCGYLVYWALGALLASGTSCATLAVGVASKAVAILLTITWAVLNIPWRLGCLVYYGASSVFSCLYWTAWTVASLLVECVWVFLLGRAALCALGTVRRPLVVWLGAAALVLAGYRPSFTWAGRVALAPVRWLAGWVLWPAAMGTTPCRLALRGLWKLAMPCTGRWNLVWWWVVAFACSKVVPAAHRWLARALAAHRRERRAIDDAKRPERLKSHTRVLYHQTSPDKAEVILRDQQMRRGTAGLAGGGIYFAESPAATEAKAHRKGVVLEAVVALGSVKELGRGGDAMMTFSKLRSTGHDSVRLSGRASGVEWVVYNADQVISVRRHGPPPAAAVQPAAPRPAPAKKPSWLRRLRRLLG